MIHHHCALPGAFAYLPDIRGTHSWLGLPSCSPAVRWGKNANRDDAMAEGSLWGCNKTAKIGTAQLNVLLHEPIRPMKVPVRLSEDAIVNKRGSKAPFGTFWTTNSCGCHRPATRFLRDYEVELQFRRQNRNWEEKKVERSRGLWNGTSMRWNEFLLTATLLSIEHMTVKEPKHALYKQECWQWWASLPVFFCPFLYLPFVRAPPEK